MIQYSTTLINIITAFLILILGLVIANIIKNIIRRFLRGIELNRILEKNIKIKIKLEESLSTFIKYLIYLTTIIIALDQLGLPTRVLKIVVILVFAIIIIVIVLAFKDWVPNLIAGFYIFKSRKVNRGDVIQINGVKGKIMAINFLETKIETKNKEIIFIPNSNIIKHNVIKGVKNG